MPRRYYRLVWLENDMNNTREVLESLLDGNVLEYTSTGDLYSMIDNELMTLSYGNLKLIEQECITPMDSNYIGFWVPTQIIPESKYLKPYGGTIRGVYNGYSYAFTKEAVGDLELMYGVDVVESIQKGIDLHISGKDTSWVIEKEGYLLTCYVIIVENTATLMMYKNDVDKVE